MAYASASDVASLTKNLVGGASSFDTSTSPTGTQVNQWLSSGCAIINTVIGSMGYGAIPESSEAYGMVRDCNALFGAWRAELSRTNARTQPGERGRADFFKKAWDDCLDELKELDLSALGVPQTRTAGRVYAGGISKADKASVEGDSDRVTPRFRRGMFASKETLEAGGGTSAS